MYTDFCLRYFTHISQDILDVDFIHELIVDHGYVILAD